MNAQLDILKRALSASILEIDAKRPESEFYQGKVCAYIDVLKAIDQIERAEEDHVEPKIFIKEDDQDTA